MSIMLRIALVIGPLLICAYFLRAIRKAKMRISDAAFWFIFSLCIVCLGVFPDIAFYFSGLLGIDSPANFIWLSMITLLLVREFVSSIQISQLRSKIISLTQEIALAEASKRSDE